MRKILKRLVAYVIDMLVVLLITQSISAIPQINHQLDTYSKYYNTYIDITNNYYSFRSDIDKYYEDKVISNEEYNKLEENNLSYSEVILKYFNNMELTEDNYLKLIEEVDNTYKEDTKNAYYMMDSNNTIYLSLYLIVLIGYFVIFNLITKGQTLGKKLFRLQIIDIKGNKVKWWQYLVRALILYQGLFYLARLILILILPSSIYYDIFKIIYNIESFIEILLVSILIFRIDNRSIHDLISNTRVIAYDKAGNEIKDKLEIILNNRKNNS